MQVEVSRWEHFLYFTNTDGNVAALGMDLGNWMDETAQPLWVGVPLESPKEKLTLLEEMGATDGDGYTEEDEGWVYRPLNLSKLAPEDDLVELCLTVLSAVGLDTGLDE